MLKLRAAGCCLALALLLAPSSPCVAQDDPGDSLRRAASAGDLAKVQELLAAGVDVNAANKYGATALAYASDKGHTEVVKLLLEKGANPNSKDTFYNSTPLNWAVQKGHAEIVRALLEKGAEGEAGALAGAASEGKADIVKVILDRGKLSPEQLGDALEVATKEKHAEVVTLLQAAGAKPPVVVTVDPAVLKTYEGVYESPRFNLTIALKDGKLIGTAEGESLTLAATDPVTFRTEEVAGIKVTFQVEAGKVTGLSLDQGGSPLLFKKKETP
jgi:Ankyrin repeats (3 copies)/Domain of unknown function (DUF3471)